MCVKVFLLGLPGSGKTAAAHCISPIVARDKGYTIKEFNDYDILHRQFEAAPSGPQFSRTENGGFNVLNCVVLDTSLQEIEQKILQEKLSDEELVIIEFARNDYLHALQQFSASFLRNSYFLFIDAEDTTCRERIYQRYTHYSSRDDHFVAKETFDKHYDKGRDYNVFPNINRLCDRNEMPYYLSIQKSTVVDNSRLISRDAFYLQIEQITLLMIEQKNIVLQETGIFSCS